MTTGPAAQPRGALAHLQLALQPHPGLPWLLAPAGVTLQVLTDAEPVRVPNTRAWFLGVASQRGLLLPVIDLAEWAGLRTPHGQRRHIVSIGSGPHAFAVPCHTPPALLATADAAPWTGDDGPLSAFLGRHFTSPHGNAREFDVARWLTSVAHEIPGAAIG